MSVLPTLPIVVTLLSAILALLARRRPRLQEAIAVSGAVALLAAAVALLLRVAGEGVVVSRMGSWPSPFAIVLVADRLAALMVTLTGVVALTVVIYARAEVATEQRTSGFYPLLHVLLAGVCGAFLTGDLFNLFVWFEVLLIASFVLLVLGGGRRQLAGAIRYVALNLLSSAIFLTGVGMVYGVAHSLEMAELRGRLALVAEDHPGLVLAIAALMSLSFALKAGLFPLFFWLPASYPTPPAAISALFAGLLTKVGVYALLRVLTLVFPPLPGLFPTLLAAAALTMLTGVAGAYAQRDVRRILSFHIISQIGYMVMGLGLLTALDPDVRRAALAAAIFYIGHHILVKTALFLVGGTVRSLRGTEALDGLGGLAVTTPWLAALFAVFAASLAGIPPLSGFWAKLAILQAGLSAGAYLAVGAAVATGLVTLLSMLKIWNEAFFRPEPRSAAPPPEPPGRPRLALLVLPVIALAVLSLWLGLAPQALLGFAQEAAGQLLDPVEYLAAVQVPGGGG